MDIILSQLVSHLLRAFPSSMCRTERHRFEPRPTHYFYQCTYCICMSINYMQGSIAYKDGGRGESPSILFVKKIKQNLNRVEAKPI